MKFRTLAASLCAALLASGAAAQQKVQIGCTATGDCASAMVAIDEGIFKKHGLEAEIPRAAGGAVVVLVHDVVGREDLEHPREVARASDRDRCPRHLLVLLQGHLRLPRPYSPTQGSTVLLPGSSVNGKARLRAGGTAPSTPCIYVR